VESASAIGIRQTIFASQVEPKCSTAGASVRDAGRSAAVL